MRKRKRNGKGHRTQGKPVQFYVPENVHAALQGLAERRGETISAIVRNWLKRAIAAELGRARAAKVPPPDPRQIQFFESPDQQRAHAEAEPEAQREPEQKAQRKRAKRASDAVNGQVEA